MELVITEQIREEDYNEEPDADSLNKESEIAICGLFEEVVDSAVTAAVAAVAVVFADWL